jgi:hypothetical protein
MSLACSTRGNTEKLIQIFIKKNKEKKQTINAYTDGSILLNRMYGSVERNYLAR